MIREQGWGIIARQVDRAVIQELGKVGTREWLNRALGAPVAKVGAATKREAFFGTAGHDKRYRARFEPNPTTPNRGIIYFRRSA